MQVSKKSKSGGGIRSKKAAAELARLAAMDPERRREEEIKKAMRESERATQLQKRLENTMRKVVSVTGSDLGKLVLPIPQSMLQPHLGHISPALCCMSGSRGVVENRVQNHPQAIAGCRDRPSFPMLNKARDDPSTLGPPESVVLQKVMHVCNGFTRVLPC